MSINTARSTSSKPKQRYVTLETTPELHEAARKRLPPGMSLRAALRLCLESLADGSATIKSSELLIINDPDESESSEYETATVDNPIILYVER
jgi:hypothetical protein